MAFTETKAIDQITVTENGVILCREVSRVLRDGVEIAHTYHRTTLEPGQDLAGQPDNVTAIAQAAWTPEVVAAYQAKIAEQQAAA